MIKLNRKIKKLLPYRIVIRRITWDPSWEEPLLDDPGSLKLLYLQVLFNILLITFKVRISSSI